MSEAALILKINYKTFSRYAKELNVFKPNKSGKGIKKSKVKLEDILSNKVKFSTQQLKKRLIDEGVLEYKCSKCFNDGFWLDEVLILELDHINGDNKDNKLENLRILCPNCHSQTPTFRGRDREKFIKKNKENKKEDKECKCGNVILKKSNLCVECNYLKQRKVKRPNYKILLMEIEEFGYSAVGRKYNVSDNSIRKWVKFYEKTM
jgi:Zn finger protein HypA/HybF involved in hydrogenase expression